MKNYKSKKQENVKSSDGLAATSHPLATLEPFLSLIREAMLLMQQ